MTVSPALSLRGKLAYLHVESGDDGLEARLTIGTARSTFPARSVDPQERPVFDMIRVAPEAVERAGAAFVDRALDPELRRVLEQWSRAQIEDPVLVIHAVGDLCAGLPWELLPAGLRAPTMFVVRAPELDLDLEDNDGDWLRASGVRIR